MSGTPTSVYTGSTLTVNWDFQTRTPTSTDWVALFRVGDPNNGVRQWWAYTGTAATGSRTLTSPATAGTYEFRLFANNTTTLLATSAPITVTAPPAGSITVTPSVTSVATGGAISVSWSMTGRTPAANDWVGLYLVGSANTSQRFWWQYTGGGATGTKTLTAPATAGDYEFRLFGNNTYTLLATSAPVTVGGGGGTVPTATLSASPLTISSGQSSTLTWSSTNATSCTASGGWTGTQAASGTQSVSPTATTTYSLTCTGAGGTSPASSATVTVSGGTVTATVTGSPTTVATSGALSVSWSMTGRTPTSTDWIGLFLVGSANTSQRFWWQYTGGGATGTKTLFAPATAGNYEFRLFAQNTYTLLATSAAVGVGVAPPLAITTTSLPAGSVSIPYNATLAASGGVPPYTWSITSGTLPAGLALAGSTGVISGTPTATASPSLTFQVRDTAGTTTTRALTLSISNAPPATATLSSNPTSIIQGQSSTLTWSSTNATSCTASGGWTGTQAASGTQVVTPAVTTTYNLTCAGPGGASAMQSTTVLVSATLTITTASLPSGGVGLAYSVTLEANGGTPPYSWALIGGTLPSGMSFSPGGVLSGTPTAAAAPTLTFQVTDSVAATATRSLTLNITQPTVPQASLSANPLSIASGQSSTLTWNSNAATGCTASGGWTGAKAVSGTQAVTPTVTTIYNLTCAGAGGTSPVQSVTVTVTGGGTAATVTGTPTSLMTGSALTVTWDLGTRTPTSTDWVALFRVGDPNNGVRQWWAYTGGAATGSLTPNAPATAGSYEFRLFANNTTTLLAVSAPITVTAPPAGSITVTPSVTSVAISGPLSVSWSMTGRTPAANDWIGLYRVGSANTSQRFWWQYTGGGATGTKTLTAPATAGDYEFRLFGNNTYTLLATSVPVVVGSTVPAATLTANPASIIAGSSSTLTWSSTNATSCASGGGFTTGGAVSGTATVSPAATTTYSITCTGASGTSPAATATVTVTQQPGPIHNLSTGTEVYNYANLPWGRYFRTTDSQWIQTFGMDFGSCPLFDARRLVNNAQVATDLDALAQRGVQGIRWWVIPDGRNLTFNASRTATGRGAGFREDLHRALDLLSARNMGVIITLFDGNTWFKPEGTFQGALFGHAQSIQDTTKRQALYNTVVIPILRDLADWAALHPTQPFPVTAIDVINEPYFGSTLGQLAPQTGTTMAQMQTLVREVAALVRQHLPGVPVTVGEARPGLIVSHWTDAALGVPAGQGLDFFSFHHFGIEPLEGPGSVRALHNLDQLGKRVYLQEFPTKNPPLFGPQPYLAPIAGTRSGRTSTGWLAGSYPWSFTAQGDVWTADDPLPDLNDIQSWYVASFDRPDLAVVPITIPTLQSGNTHQFVVSVVNQGGILAPSSRFELRVDGTLIHSATLPALLPGEFTAVTAPAWTAATGSHTLLAQADTLGQVSEPLETNNDRTVSFTVFPGPMPDLVIQSVTMPPLLFAGQSATFTVTVLNSGTAPAASNRLEGWIDGTMIGAVTVPALAANASANLVLPAWTATAGNHDLWVKADIFEVVAELDEANNERNTSFTVGTAPPVFGLTRRIIDPARSGDCKCLGDVNGDGQVDAIMGGTEMAWYPLPSTVRNVISTASSEFTTDCQTADVDNDGDLDIITADSSGPVVVWLENPRPGGSPSSTWTKRIISTFDGPWAHDIEVGDLDRDGRVDVIARNQATNIFFQNSPTSWIKRDITAVVGGGEGLGIGDIDRDGDLDLATTGGWIETPAAPRTGVFVRREIGAGFPADTTAAIADLNGDTRPDIVFIGQHTRGKFAWYEGPPTPSAGPWVEHMIDANMGSHKLNIADMNLDGRPDLITGLELLEAALYFNSGGVMPAFAKTVISSLGTHNQRIADVGADGDIDIVGANWIGHPPLEWWENTTR